MVSVLTGPRSPQTRGADRFDVVWSSAGDAETDGDRASPRALDEVEQQEARRALGARAVGAKYKLLLEERHVEEVIPCVAGGRPLPGSPLGDELSVDNVPRHGPDFVTEDLGERCERPVGDSPPGSEPDSDAEAGLVLPLRVAVEEGPPPRWRAVVEQSADVAVDARRPEAEVCRDDKR